MSEVKGISETVLYVDNMHRSVAFYHRLFGFSVMTSSGRLSALRVAPFQVLLIARKGATANPNIFPSGTVPSGQLNEWRTTLKLHSVEVESEIDWPTGGQSLYFRDPDQHCIELKTSDWNGNPVPEAEPTESKGE
jgi:catechol 2,3-dioxygenase-like lactoylglutathione lyase family enzyme